MTDATRFQFNNPSVPKAYDEFFVPRLFEPWAKLLLEAADLRRGESVLDIATGPGTVARLAAVRLGAEGRVVAIDIAQPMLDIAKAKAPPPGAAPIEYLKSPSAPLPAAAGAFDAVLCQQGLQFFPDRPAALREMRRVLGPAGRVALSTWRDIGRSPGFAALAEALARHVPAAVPTIRGPFALGDAEELRALVAGAGSREVAIRPLARTLRFPSAEEFVRRYVAGSPLAGPVGQADETARGSLLRDVAAAPGPPG